MTAIARRHDIRKAKKLDEKIGKETLEKEKRGIAG